MKESKCPAWTLRDTVTGPLAAYVDGFCSWLYSQGFCRNHIGRQIRQVARFSSWLSSANRTISEISHSLVEGYVDKKNRHSSIRTGEQATLRRFIAYLQENGIALPDEESRPMTAVETQLSEFGNYLLHDRCLSPKTKAQYLPTIQQFLDARFGNSEVDLRTLTGSDIIQFVQDSVTRKRTARGKVVVDAMRAFLRYGIHRHQLSPDLLLAVPKVASWSQAGIIKAISPEETEQLLLSCDLNSVSGVRDFAVLMLLARLGLRAAEIASLSLDAIDWESGTLSFTGKSGKHACLPLPEEVGEALAKYLQLRPLVSSCLFFIRTLAPLRPLGAPQSVISIVNSAVKRAGISPPTKGTHQFRYGLATSMLKRGADLIEIGSILRHEQPKTTNLYAKVDIGSLRALSPAWQGGEL